MKGYAEESGCRGMSINRLIGNITPKLHKPSIFSKMRSRMGCPLCTPLLNLWLRIVAREI